MVCQLNACEPSGRGSDVTKKKAGSASSLDSNYVFTSVVMAGAEGVQSAQDGSPQTENTPPERFDKKCIFCRIVNSEMDTELLHRVSTVTEQ